MGVSGKSSSRMQLADILVILLLDNGEFMY